jgi:hypothetical protein
VFDSGCGVFTRPPLEAATGPRFCALQIVSYGRDAARIFFVL